MIRFAAVSTAICYRAQSLGHRFIGVLAAGSRGLHLDGLADTADGLAASYDRAHSLEVMRRGNTGPIGAATLVLVLLLQVAATASLLGRPWGPLAAGGLICLSRASFTTSVYLIFGVFRSGLSL